MIVKYLLTFTFSISTFCLLAQDIFWSEHIAPIIYDNCSSCHHEDGIAPFKLMAYDDVVPYGDLIHHAVEELEMPPWPADPAYRHFVGEARLKQSEIEAIHNWIDNDMPYGDPTLEPTPPVFPLQGSLLDQIDYTVAIEPYTLQSNTDEYRWFVIENPFTEPVYISQLEVLSGLEQIVHHADLFYDLSGNSLAYDLADPLPGFNGNTGWPNNDYYINAWQPGGNIASYPDNWGIMIPPEADFVIEIHYGPGGIGLIDSTIMNLKFVANPVDVREVRAAWLLWDSAPMLVDGPLVIPANEVVTFHQVSAPLSQALSLISICPHMHWLGKSYKVWAETPAGDTIKLIDIPQWDFHWQKYYTFQQVQKIPAGSVLKSEGVYDNTTNNHDNLNDPPITVYKGSTTNDEMFLCYFIYANYQSGDEDIVMDSTDYASPTFEPLNVEEAYQVFPNPSTAVIHLTGELSKEQKLNFQIRNTLGEVLHRSLRTNVQSTWNESFDVKHLTSGIYFIEWWDGQRLRSVEFVKL